MVGYESKDFDPKWDGQQQIALQGLSINFVNKRRGDYEKRKKR